MKVLDNPDKEVSQQISCLKPLTSTINHITITKPDLRAVKSNALF